MCVADTDGVVNVEVHLHATDTVLELEDGNLGADQVYLV